MSAPASSSLSPAASAGPSPFALAPSPGAAATPPAPIPSGQRRVYAFVAFPGHRNRAWLQKFLGQHFPRLWEEIRVKWIPTARPIANREDETLEGMYEREVLSDLLITLGEAGIPWDGYEVGSKLEYPHGWRTDFHLCALIHAWSTGLARTLR